MEINTKETKLISAVVYLHNDEQRILIFLDKIILVLERHFQSFEIILVNDCSFDQSITKIKEATDLKKFNISIINMSVRQGLEASMNAGIDLSMGDFVYEFDDLNIDYDDSLIIDAYNSIVNGFDIISVSPTKDNTFSSKLFYSTFNKFSRSKYKLNSERFRILSRRAINRAYSISKSIPYRKALYANSGLSLSTIKYKPNFNKNRKLANTKDVFRNRMAINALILYTNLAFKISLWITVALFCFTLFAGLYALSLYFGNEKPIEGWTTTMLLISSSFSGLFFISAIIIKYLALIVELIYSKKTYLIESVERL
jgi:glycosyltransferase involved in cell wall biosynthesis